MPKKKMLLICQFSFRVALKLQISGAETRSRVERGNKKRFRLGLGFIPVETFQYLVLIFCKKIANN